MERILEKLKQMEHSKRAWENWSLEEKKRLLEIYHLFSQKEAQIFDLIYKYHGCDSWEDIFRDYDEVYLKDKTDGVEIAIKEIDEQLLSS